MQLLIFVDLYAILFTAAVSASAVSFFAWTTSGEKRLMAIGSFIHLGTLVFGIAYIVRALAVAHYMGALGQALATSLLTIMYGALIKLALLVAARYLYPERNR